MGLNEILAAVILAGFAGMSEYVILWTSHRKQEYGIALANAFGGITQLLFLIVPFTLGSIAIYPGFINPTHPDFPISFSVSNILLVIFLFPTFHTLAALLENDHTLGILDTVIMVSIVGLLLLLLIFYSGAESPVAPLKSGSEVDQSPQPRSTRHLNQRMNRPFRPSRLQRSITKASTNSLKDRCCLNCWNSDPYVTEAAAVINMVARVDAF